MRIIAYTNQGPSRDHNEDAVFFPGSLMSGNSMNVPSEFNSDAKNGCCVVIDGMGGCNGGEIAARIIAMSFLSGQYGWNISTEKAQEKVSVILANASKRIASIAADKPDLASMGAALAGIAICNDSVVIFNCGDCRVYHLQSHQYLDKLSHDHSVVQELHDKGELDDDGMRTHPRKNIITSSVSADAEGMLVDFKKAAKSKAASNFFVCSDGVWEALSVDEIEKCFVDKSYYDGAVMLAEKLTALKEGCKDNISFLIVEV